ncbi:hypothetical protein C0J52_24553 [Blattella germanica]|nr:hypothetical protein C0J52_24553 [Blattella germanica]
MCDNQTNRSRGISDNTAFTAACSVLQTMSVSSSRRYRYSRDSNTNIQLLYKIFKSALFQLLLP